MDDGPEKARIKPYTGPAGGWGSVRSVARTLLREKVPPASTPHQLVRQNKPDGFACVSCAWGKRVGDDLLSHDARLFCGDHRRAPAHAQ